MANKTITVKLTEDQARMLADNLEQYLYHTEFQNDEERAFMLRTWNNIKKQLAQAKKS